MYESASGKLRDNDAGTKFFKEIRWVHDIAQSTRLGTAHLNTVRQTEGESTSPQNIGFDLNYILLHVERRHYKGRGGGYYNAPDYEKTETVNTVSSVNENVASDPDDNKPEKDGSPYHPRARRRLPFMTAAQYLYPIIEETIYQSHCIATAGADLSAC